MRLKAAGTLDTNILLRFLLADVPPQHKKARELIESAKIWHVSVLSIAEIVFILTRIAGFPREQIKTNLELLSSYANLDIPRSIVLPALDLYVRQPSISFMDACLAAEAEDEYATPLWTFDQKLAKHAAQAKLLSV